MQKRKSVDYRKLRKQVAKIFIGVLTEKINVSYALTCFPKDCDDKTINASWHALCHLEADEDIRVKDNMYKKEQDEYIEFIAYTLEKGEELPENIINSYIPFHPDALTPNSHKLKGIIHTLKKFLCC
mgnify:CR=1 FL=1